MAIHLARLPPDPARHQDSAIALEADVVPLSARRATNISVRAVSYRLYHAPEPARSASFDELRVETNEPSLIPAPIVLLDEPAAALAGVGYFHMSKALDFVSD
jgi:hypothetical protein